MYPRQEEQELKQQIKSNQHEIFIVSMEEMDAIVRSSAKWNSPQFRNNWQKLKGKAEKGATYYASADDLRTLSKLVNDLGGFTSHVYIKTYGGKPHIILKGNPQLRRILTGTKYGIKNPKVITMGLGKSGATHVVKQGGIISVVCLSVYRVVDYFLTDQATLSQLVGSLSTDIVKVGIAMGASIAAVSFLSGVGVTLAIGPLVVVVFVGLLASITLNVIDDQYGITDRIIAGLDEISASAQSYVEQLKGDLQDKANYAVASVIDYVIDISRQAVINFSKHQINKFKLNRPGFIR